jgi:hypothetical protein
VLIGLAAKAKGVAMQKLGLSHLARLVLILIALVSSDVCSAKTIIVEKTIAPPGSFVSIDVMWERAEMDTEADIPAVFAFGIQYDPAVLRVDSISHPHQASPELILWYGMDVAPTDVTGIAGFLIFGIGTASVTTFDDQRGVAGDPNSQLNPFPLLSFTFEVIGNAGGNSPLSVVNFAATTADAAIIEDVTFVDGVVDVLDPANVQDFYITTSGDDSSLDGSVSNPWRTIGHAVDVAAPFASVDKPVTLHLGPGTFDEAVALAPYLNLVGAGQDQTILQNSDVSELADGIVRGAEGAQLSDCKLLLPEDTSEELSVLLRIENTSMTVDNVVFDGAENLSSYGIFVSGAASSATVIHDCTIENLQFGVHAVNSGATITKNLIQNVRSIGVFVDLPSGKGDEASSTPRLGSRTNIEQTGLNRFRDIDGIFVQNLNPENTAAEMNDWGVYMESEISAHMLGKGGGGGVDFVPFIGMSVGPGALVAQVLDGSSSAPVAVSSNPVVTLSGFSVDPIYDETSGVFVFEAVPAGNWTVNASADGYEATEQQMTVNPLSINSVDLFLYTSGQSGTACPAKAVLGSNAQELKNLRRFRDTVLKQSLVGQGIVGLYYWSAPYTTTIVQKSAVAHFTFHACCEVVNTLFEIVNPSCTSNDACS